MGEKLLKAFLATAVAMLTVFANVVSIQAESMDYEQYENEIPGFNATDYETLNNGYVLTNNGGNNHAISSVSAKEFTLDTDITFVEGTKASFMFGAESSRYEELAGNGKFYGLEFNKNLEKNVLEIKMFHEHGMGDGVIPYTTAVSNINDKNTFHVKVAYSDANKLQIWVDGNEVNYTVAPDKDFEGNYTGGYIGFLTYCSTAKFKNIVLEAGNETYTSLPDFNATNAEEIITGYHMKNTGGNNISSSQLYAESFTYEGTVTYNSGNKASFVFGAENEDHTKLGWGKEARFFGLEFDRRYNGEKQKNEIWVKMFHDGPNSLGDGLIPYTYVADIDGDSMALKIAMDQDNNLSVAVNGTLLQATIADSFKTTYAGGYIGFLTFQSDVTFTNTNILVQKMQEGNFQTNLSELKGRNGTWKVTENGLYSTGGGDNFALSATEASNFIYEADVTFAKGAEGAASLVFRSTDDPANGSYVANLDKNQKTMRIFKFPGGVNVGTAAVTEDKDTYHLRVEALDSSLKYYVDDVLVVAGNDTAYTNGKLGLLTYNSSITYQNVNYKEISEGDIPTLTDLQVSGDQVTFTPQYRPDTARYHAYLPSGATTMNVMATASDGCTMTYSMRGQDGIVYDQGVLTSKQEKTITPAYGASKMIIDVTKGDITSSIVIDINKKADSSYLAEEDYRPQLHFSPEINFMNDPNGLVYDPSNQTWHLFFQYSPQLPQMGSQTWGHAVSDDLVSWTELPVAIEMDKFGAIFSGSCVVDENNTSGFFTDNKQGESKLVAIYTNAGSYGMVQNIAYSKDHGVTWTKYETADGSAVIPDTYHDGFRDPKVFKIDEAGPWYMIVAGGRARIFASENLKEWTLVDELFYQNGQELHSECPGLYPLEVLDQDGNPTGDTKWVYNASSEFYVIGHLETKNVGGKEYYTFKADTNQVESQTGGESSAYAAQTFYNDGTGKNRIMTVHWYQDYSAPSYAANKRWNGVQSIPLETTLKRLDDGSYLVCQRPVEEVEALRAGVLFETVNTVVAEDDANILNGISAQVYEVEAVFDMNKTTAKEFGFELRSGSGEKTIYKYDTASKQMILDKSSSNSKGYENQILKHTLTPTKDGKIVLRAIVDNSVIETFGNDGDAHLLDLLLASPTSVGMAFFAKGGEVAIDDCKVYDMKSIYTGKSIAENTTKTYVSLIADSYVDTNEEFVVTVAVYPTDKLGDIAWKYDDKALKLVRKDDKSITLVPAKDGTYTIEATIAGVKASVQVEAMTRKFTSNVVGWKAVNGVWTKTDQGMLGQNSTTGDVFYVSNAYLPADAAFTYEADMNITSGVASGLLFGVMDREHPAAHWYCLNSDLSGGHFKLFKNTGAQNWASTAAFDTFKDTTKYRLKVVYDGNGNFTYYAAEHGTNNFVELGQYKDESYTGGYFGIMTFRSDAFFDNVMLQTDGVAEKFDAIEDVVVTKGAAKDTLMALLPTTVRITQTDGIQRDATVTWDASSVDLDIAGTYTITTQVDDLTITMHVVVQEKTDPIDPVDPSVPTDPSDPKDPVDPNKPSDPSQPTRPIDPTNPVLPMKPGESTNPTESKTEGTHSEAVNTGDTTSPAGLLVVMIFAFAGMAIASKKKKMAESKEGTHK